MLLIRLLLVASLLCGALAAQTTEVDLKARLLHQPLYLRGQWHERKLNFDSVGHLVGTSTPFPFTLSGMNVQSVKLDGKGLRIDGDRVGIEFTKDKMIRQPLGEAIHIDIAPAASGDYTPALDAIFFSNAADFVSSLPAYWQGAYTEALLTGSPVPARTKPSAAPGTERIGGAVIAPRALKTPEPTFNDYARRVKLSGNVVIYLQVDPSGNPDKLRILRPLGLGLDEMALNAVSRYRFKPAEENGVPVRVEMNVEVNFQIF